MRGRYCCLSLYLAAGCLSLSACSDKQADETASSDQPRVAASQRVRLASFGQGLPTRGQWRDGFAVADMNSDGHLDIVHGSPRPLSEPPTVFLGDGNGGWQVWAEADFPKLQYAYGDVAVGDLNGDGHMDIALAMHMTGFAVLLGDGKGGFTNTSRGLPQATAGGTVTFSSRRLSLVDWNGDGMPDILALGEGPRIAASAPGGSALDHQARGVALFLNRLRQQGSTPVGWEARLEATGPAAIFGRALAIGDFNNDKRSDFLTGSSIYGRRDLLHLQTEAGGWQAQTIDVIRPQAYIRAVAVGDFNADGTDDLAIGYVSMQGQWRSGIDLLLQDGEKWRRQALLSEPGRDGIWALASGDVDGDGHIDLVALGEQGEVHLFLGGEGGSFTHERHLRSIRGDGCRGAHLELADLNGDGSDEIVAAFAFEADAESARCPGRGGLNAWRVMPRK